MCLGRFALVVCSLSNNQEKELTAVCDVTSSIRWYVAANTLLMLNPLCRDSSTLPSLMSDGEYDLSFEDFTYMPNFRRGIGHAYRSLDCVASSNKTFVSPS